MLSLLRECGRGDCGIRDQALIVVLWRGGLRCAEALALRPRDIDRSADGMTIRVAHGKGDKSRTVAIGIDAAAIVGRWIDIRSEKYPGRFIFCRIKRRGDGGGAITGSVVRKLLSALGKKAGIEKRVHAHGFRHTFALELDAERVPLSVIQQSLGHTNVSTTSNYLTALGSQQVIGALQSRKIEN